MKHPPNSASGPDRTRRRTLVSTASVVVALILVVAAGCASRSDPETPTVMDRFKESSIHSRETLRIGVYDDSPLMSLLQSGDHTGFEIELARGIAAFLGFREDQIMWVSLTPADRISSLQRGETDLVIAGLAMTEERKKSVRFAGPYLVTTQELLVPTAVAREIRTIADLRNSRRRVCVVGDAVSKQRLTQEGILVDTVTNIGDCEDGLLKNQFDAMSADRTVLAGIRSRRPGELTIVDLPFDSAELLGVAVPRHDAALQDLIGHYLMRSYVDDTNGRSNPWRVAYDNNLGPWLGRLSQPVPMDAAILLDYDTRDVT